MAVSKNAQILRLIMEIDPGISRTKLLKLVYLSDHDARQYLGKPISDLEYMFYKQGPFDVAFYDAKDELLHRGLAEEVPTDTLGYQGYEYNPTDKEVEFDYLTEAEIEIVRHLATQLKGMTATQVCDDIVYQTDPMKKANQLDLLDMDMLNNRVRKREGFDFERLLVSEASAAAGDYRPMADVVNGLRSFHNSAS